MGELRDSALARQSPPAPTTLEHLLQTNKFAYHFGIAIGLGPDHRVRLRAVGLFLQPLKVIGKIQTSRTGPTVHRFLRVLISIAEYAAQIAARG